MIFEKAYNFFDGQFGRRVLKPKYRKPWRLFWRAVWLCIALLIFFGIMQMMQTCTDFVNYVYWGIGAQ